MQEHGKGIILMRYFLGIDGGGTKTEALVCTDDGVIVGKGIAGPSNSLFVEKSIAFENIGKSIHMALKDYSGEISFASAAVCIPGIKRYRDEVKTQLLNNCKNTYIDADELNAFCSALAKPYGIVVLGGTGSFALGFNKKGDRAEIGGWGPLIGDEGSGYYIGVSSLKSVIREYEGAGDKTSLTTKIMKTLGLNEIPELRRAIYSKEFDRKAIGNLSRIVHESALEGDSVSIEIINDAARHLADLVNRVVKRLQMYDGEYEAILTGGASNFGDLILIPFTEFIKKENININVVKPKFVPAVGALMIAMKESGIDVYTQIVLNNLSITYKNLTNG